MACPISAQFPGSESPASTTTPSSVAIFLAGKRVRDLGIHPQAYPLWGPWGAQHSFGAQLAAGLGMCHLHFTAFLVAFSLQGLRLPDPMWGEEGERMALFYEYRAPILPI